MLYRGIGKVIALEGLLVLAACGTPYQDMGFLGGVEATQIDSNTFRITASGNAYTGTNTVQNYALLKAADTTLAQGCDYFVILGAQDRSSTSYSETPVQAQSSTNLVGPTAVTNTTMTGGDIETLFKPGQALMIKVYKGQKPDQANAFDAHEIETYIGPKVKRSAGAVVH
jgi:transcriptional regulator of nitric oxide reductase